MAVKKSEGLESIFAGMGCGKIGAEPFAVINGKEIKAEKIVFSRSEESAFWQGTAAKKYVDTLSFSCRGTELVCRRAFKNISGKVLHLNELGFRLSGLSMGGKPLEDFFYHPENPRIYEVMAFPVDYKRTAKDAKDSRFDVQAGNRWSDPGVICDRIGRSPYQPFPALLVGNFKRKHGLVHGTLEQRLFYHNYLLRHEKGNGLVWEIFSSLKDVAWREVRPGEVLMDEWYLGTTEQADNLEKIFDGYTVELRKRLQHAFGATDINRTTMVWGSWNDGVWRDVSEELLLEQAAFLKKNFPTVRWIQLDDGYAVYNKIAHGLGMPYEGAAGVDSKKFPHGLRGYTDRLRQIGLRPALWIGGFCPKETKIYREHPEWFINYDYRVKDSAPLDVSQPEVREYMMKALDALVTEAGFEGVKHDFWSYAFEDSQDLYKNKDRSGYEYRRWWLQQMRDRLPADGYYQTGCDIVMGNPFLGEFFTNYRYGIDIGNGNWENVKINFLWGMTCFATHTGDLFVPNSDSVGLYPGLKENEAMFALNYCLVTHSMVEIAGLLSRHVDSPRIPILKKAVCNPNNGQDIFFTRWNYLDHREKYPAAVYFRTGHFCPQENQPGLPLRTVGLFNLEEKVQKLGFTAKELGLPAGNYLLKDIWTGEEIPLKGRFACSISAHASRVLAVCAAEGPRLLDANTRVLSSQLEKNTLLLQLDYEDRNVEMTFGASPKQIWLNGRKISGCRGKERTLKLAAVPAGAQLKVSF